QSRWPTLMAISRRLYCDAPMLMAKSGEQFQGRSRSKIGSENQLGNKCLQMVCFLGAIVAKALALQVFQRN
ncbi:MAG: hypothetical protein ACO331_10780, partial [Prochlorothrix sp.]